MLACLQYSCVYDFMSILNCNGNSGLCSSFYACGYVHLFYACGLVHLFHACGLVHQLHACGFSLCRSCAYGSVPIYLQVAA
jgi:hypothetical protein